MRLPGAAVGDDDSAVDSNIAVGAEGEAGSGGPGDVAGYRKVATPTVAVAGLLGDVGASVETRFDGPGESGVDGEVVGVQQPVAVFAGGDVGSR